MTFACSREEVAPTGLANEQHLIVSANEVAGLKEALHSKIKADRNGGFSVYQSAEQAESEFTIDYNNVRQSIDSIGNEIFTFGLIDKDNDPKTFLNMILKKDIDHGYQTPYILKFEMTDEFLQEFLRSRSLLHFEGTIKKLALSDNHSPSAFQANIKNVQSSASTVSCPDGNTLEMSGHRRKHDRTTSHETSNNTGSSGTIVTTYEICEYFLVTTEWTINKGTAFEFTWEDTTIEVECRTETFNDDFTLLSANTASNPCDALSDDVGVFYPNGELIIWIANLDAHPCTSEIFEDIQQITNGGMRDIIDQFAQENSNFDYFIEVVESSLDLDDPDNSAETNWVDGILGLYQTTISKEYLNNATKPSIARTLMHEAIHAYLLSEVDAMDISLSIQQKQEFKTDFPLLWDFYILNTGDGNSAHHETMAERFRETISSGLIGLFGDSYSNKFYDQLAWGGLTGTSAFINNTDLSNQEK